MFLEIMGTPCSFEKEDGRLVFDFGVGVRRTLKSMSLVDIKDSACDHWLDVHPYGDRAIPVIEAAIVNVMGE